MASMLVCTGKKRAVKKVMAHFLEMNKKKSIEIIAHIQRTKKAMIWDYEELKLLFHRTDSAPMEIEARMVKSVDILQIRTPRGVVVKMTTFTSEDKNLKWNLISRTTSFQLRGGRVDIREDINTENRRESRTCHISLAGPCASVLIVRDLLIKDKLVDPKSVEFSL